MNSTSSIATQLYVLTLPHIENEADFVRTSLDIIQTGKVAAFQLRLKETDQSIKKRVGRILLSSCKEHKVAFIVNDDIEMALELKADGVHIGEEEGSYQPHVLKAIRQDLGEYSILGVSCYDSYDRAMIAGEYGANYVSFGAFYPSSTKQSRGNPEVALLEDWVNCTVLPVVAIGGITEKNLAPLVKAGADFIAVTAAVWHYPAGAVAGVTVLHKAIEHALSLSSV